MENKWCEFYCCLSLLPWECFQATGQEEGYEAEPVDFLSLGDRAEPRETEAARVQRPEKRGLNTGRTPEVYKDPTWVLYQHMHGRMLAKSGGKNYQKGLEITESGVHIRPGIASVPTNKTGKPHDSQSMRKSTHKGLASVVGKSEP